MNTIARKTVRKLLYIHLYKKEKADQKVLDVLSSILINRIINGFFIDMMWSF